MRSISGYTNRSNACVIRQHQPAHAMAHWHIRTPLRQRHLNTGRAPRDKRGQLSFPDTQQTLMHIRRIHLALNHIQNGNVTALLARYRRHHAVLWLQQSPHHVQHRRLTDCLSLLNLVTGEWRVGRHEEVASRCRYQRSQNANKIIVHVSRIA